MPRPALPADGSLDWCGVDGEGRGPKSDPLAPVNVDQEGNDEEVELAEGDAADLADRNGNSNSGESRGDTMAR